MHHRERKTQSSPAGVPVSDFENLDYYELLGVSRSAPFDEIKRAYRREISKYHPDRFANAMPHEQAYASERSQRITEAYSILSDTAARSAYTRGQALEHLQRARAPVHEIAQQIETVARGGEVQGGQQSLESVAAALQVADQVNHGPDSATLAGPQLPARRALPCLSWT